MSRPASPSGDESESSEWARKHRWASLSLSLILTFPSRPAACTCTHCSHPSARPAQPCFFFFFLSARHRLTSPSPRRLQSVSLFAAPIAGRVARLSFASPARLPRGPEPASLTTPPAIRFYSSRHHCYPPSSPIFCRTSLPPFRPHSCSPISRITPRQRARSAPETYSQLTSTVSPSLRSPGTPAFYLPTRRIPRRNPPSIGNTGPKKRLVETGRVQILRALPPGTAGCVPAYLALCAYRVDSAVR